MQSTAVDDQKSKIRNRLVHRIRVIQGQTNLNCTESDLIESKENIRQTKSIINSIKHDLKKGCSDVLRTTKDKFRFASDTTSTLAGTEISIKQRQLNNILHESDKSPVKEERRKGNLYNISNSLYESGERPDIVSTSKLSQAVGKGSNKVMQVTLDNLADGKIQKKKKRKKRKREEIEVTSSMTLTHSNTNVCNFVQGDSRPSRPNPRKNRERYSARRKLECSGDESDVEDDSTSRLDDISGTKPKFPRRRLRPKHSQRRISDVSDVSLTQNERSIRDMVSSTITKLNSVNEHVTRVIEESLSSDQSFVLEKSIMNSRRTLTGNTSRTHGGNVSATSFNSITTASMSRSTLADISEIRKSGSLQTQPSVTTTPVVVIKKEPIETRLAPELGIPEINIADEVSFTKLKRKKQMNDTPKVQKETVEGTPTKEREVPKKKKSNVNNKPPINQANPAEPVSSLKKSGKKKKDKKKEHVNFANSPPEIVPDVHSEISAPAPHKKHIKAVSANPTPDDNHKQHKNPPKPQSPDHTSTTPLRKLSGKSTRRVSSAKTYRQTSKKELTKVKSTGNMDSTPRESPLTVRSVLEEEASNERKRTNSKCRNRSTSRDGQRSRSKSGSRDDRARSKSANERDDALRSREVREIYYKIRTNTTNTIANINQQMSSTLKESIAHLNDICGKVRNTLTDMEKDEQTYKRLKSKQSFEVSSEGGGSTISVHTNKPTKENDQDAPTEKPTAPQTYTVITQPTEETSIKQLMTSISMGGDTLIVEKVHSEVPPRSASSKDKKKRKSRESKKRSASKQASSKTKTVLPTVSTSKSKFSTVKTISADKTSMMKIPIWQRKPPSVIEEIQLTVKKQATKSQYREFLRALKSIARKQRSQVHVVPQEFREVMEKQQDKAFDAISKHRLAIKKRKDVKPPVETNKVCKECPPDKCTCGLTVENTVTASNLQRTNWTHVKSDSTRKGIQVYDILDEITLKDVEPIQSEYPRKDHISDADANKRVEDTLLYKLLYHEDPKVLESLLKSSCPPLEEHKQGSRISNTKTQERAKSVSDAYRLYEQLEFNADKQASVNLTPTKASICLNTSDNTSLKEKPKAVDTCTKDFDDELVIPDDLKPTIKTQAVSSAKKPSKKKFSHLKFKSADEVASLRSRKRIEDKLKVLAKTSSVRSIDKRNRKTRFSKESFKTRIKSYSADSKYKIKKILTVMPIAIIENKSRLKKGKLVNVEKSKAQRELKISEENMAKINRMSKREIVRILKPYIFFDLQPPVITVMPVFPKYNHQNKHQKQEHNNHNSKGPTLKKVMSYLKDHDDDCRNGKKLCRRCQMLMQSGDETSKKNEPPAKKFAPLSQKQLWKNKYRNTPSENLVNHVLGKNSLRKKFQTVPPEDNVDKQEVVITMTPRELNRNALNTRSKLDEVRNLMADHKPLLGQHLDDIIDALEFRIVDALSNPKNQHTVAFNEIESEIKSILSTISELRQINQENIKTSNIKLKSKTNIDLTDSSEQNEMKSKTDVNLISTSINKLIEDEISTLKKEDEPITVIDAAPNVILEEEEGVSEERSDDDTKIDETYSNLGKDIEKVIEGLDAIIHINEDVEIKGTEETIDVVKEESTVQSKQNEISLETEDPMETFCEQMDEVMKNLGNIEDGSTDTLDAFLTEDVQEKKSDEYLTPFMKAVKNYRRGEQSQNFLDFLDKLTMLSKDAVSLTIYPNMPIYQATLKHRSQIIEVANTYDQAIQCENIIIEGGVETEEKFYEANASMGALDREQIPKTSPKGDYVLSTNHWMQTDETGIEEEMEEVRDQVIQTSSTELQFHEVDEYVDSLDDETILQKTTLVSEKNTQFPSSPSHTCFAENSSKDVQVTSDLLEMTSIAVGNESGGFNEESTKTTITSVDCQIGTDPSETIFSTSPEPIQLVENLTPNSTVSDDPVATVDISGLEKYTNKMNSCFGQVSEISFNESPRTAYTDSYITKDRSKLIASEIGLCDKANSYPTTRRSSNIISLFESHKSSDDTNYTRDFLEDGFSKSPADSYDSMLVRCASSEVDAKVPSNIIAEKSPSNIISTETMESKHRNRISEKLIRQEKEEDYLHKHVLHSVYGIVFVLMFLGINLNYGCYN